MSMEDSYKQGEQFSNMRHYTEVRLDEERSNLMA